MQFDCACLCCTVCFKWIAEKTRWPFAQHIYQPRPPAATSTILPSRSIILIQSFTLFLFLYFLLGLWTKHGARCHCKACLLPSQVLSVRSSAPLRAPQSFSSVQLFCSLQKGLHLALVFFKPPLYTAFFLLVLPTPPSLRKKTGSECRCRTHLSSLLILSFSRFLSHAFPLSWFLHFFFFLQTPTAGAVATSHTEHIDILNLTVEAVHHNSNMLVCCLSLLHCCLNLYLSVMLQHAGKLYLSSDSAFKFFCKGKI